MKPSASSAGTPDGPHSTSTRELTQVRPAAHQAGMARATGRRDVVGWSGRPGHGTFDYVMQPAACVHGRSGRDGPHDRREDTCWQVVRRTRRPPFCGWDAARPAALYTKLARDRRATGRGDRLRHRCRAGKGDDSPRRLTFGEMRRPTASVQRSRCICPSKAAAGLTRSIPTRRRATRSPSCRRRVVGAAGVPCRSLRRGYNAHNGPPQGIAPRPGGRTSATGRADTLQPIPAASKEKVQPAERGHIEGTCVPP